MHLAGADFPGVGAEKHSCKAAFRGVPGKPWCKGRVRGRRAVLGEVLNVALRSL